MRVIAFLSLVSSAVLAVPDEVRMKDGTEYKNLTLKSETKTQWVFEDLDGKKLTLSKDKVAEHAKKPTVRDTFAEIRKASDPKDPTKLVALAKEATGLGLKREAREIWNEILKIDDGHVEARAALGFVKSGGKWITAAEAEAAFDKESGPVYKALGLTKVDGKWTAPAEVARKKMNLVEVQGVWVKSEQAKKIAADGLSYREGAWLTKDEVVKFDQGLRRGGREWKAAKEFDADRNTWKDPWVLKGRRVEVVSNARYEVCGRTLASADQALDAFVAFFGFEPDYYGERGLPVVLYGRTVEDYKFFGGQATPDWAAVRSSTDGVFYMPGFMKTRGASVTYFYDMWGLYAFWWGPRGALEAFLGRFADLTRIDSNILDAIAGGFAFRKGELHDPPPINFNTWLNDKTRAFEPASKLLDRNHRSNTAEHVPAQSGLFIHWLSLEKKDELRFAIMKWLAGKSDRKTFFNDATRGWTAEETDKKFAEYVETYRKDWLARPHK